MHKGGRSHRDIKPHNIVVSWKDGKVTVSLIDWAGSRLESECKHPIHTRFDMCLLLAYPSTNTLICKAFMHVWHLRERMHDEACECHTLKDMSCHDAASVCAGHLLKAAYTASYAAPQLIRYYGKLVKAMLDTPNDIWAAAAVIYQVVTSATCTQEAPGDCIFGPTIEQIDELVKVDSQEERDRMLRKGIQKEQKLWVSTLTGHWPRCC